MLVQKRVTTCQKKGMIRFFSILVVILVAVSSPVQAQDRGAWISMDSYLQSAFFVILFVDWQQTREFTGNPHKYPGKSEANPLLGSHPSPRKVNQFFAGSVLAHTGIAYLLPRPYRTIWQSVWIGVEIGAVATNASAGITMRF